MASSGPLGRENGRSRRARPDARPTAQAERSAGPRMEERGLRPTCSVPTRGARPKGGTGGGCTITPYFLPPSPSLTWPVPRACRGAGGPLRFLGGQEASSISLAPWAPLSGPVALLSAFLAPGGPPTSAWASTVRSGAATRQPRSATSHARCFPSPRRRWCFSTASPRAVSPTGAAPNGALPGRPAGTPPLCVMGAVGKGRGGGEGGLGPERPTGVIQPTVPVSQRLPSSVAHCRTTSPRTAHAAR